MLDENYRVQPITIPLKKANIVQITTPVIIIFYPYVRLRLYVPADDETTTERQ
jgi:hypothetical protein